MTAHLTPDTGQMELASLRDSLELLFCCNVSNLGDALREATLNSDTLKLDGLMDILANDLEKDHLQRIFQYYMADREDKGQDYTPPTLGRLLTTLNKPHGTVYDLCAGSGSLTVQAWREAPDAEYICEEYDSEVIPFLLTNLAIRNVDGWVIHRDALTQELFATYQLIKDEKYSKVVQRNQAPDVEANVVISNPPFNLEWDAPIPLLADERFSKHGIPPSGNANYAFVLTGLAHLKENGVAGFILPNGALTSDNEKPVRSSLIDGGFIRTALSMPEKMFEATSIPTSVLILTKEKNKTIAFADCRELHSEEVREQRGQWGGASHEQRVYKKTFNVLGDEHILQIAGALEKPQDGVSAHATVEDVAANDYNLQPSRYISYASQTVEHRPIAHIIDDINYIGMEKNVLKITVNETWARDLGLLEIAERVAGSKELYEQMKDAFALFEKTPVRDDYLRTTKSKVLKIENISKEYISSILMMLLPMWQQHLYYLNNEENRLLAELRDALLPQLMSGELSVNSSN